MRVSKKPIGCQIVLFRFVVKKGQNLITYDLYVQCHLLCVEFKSNAYQQIIKLGDGRRERERQPATMGITLMPKNIRGEMVNYISLLFAIRFIIVLEVL